MVVNPGALVAELGKDGLVGRLVRHEGLVTVRQGRRGALELGRGHLGVAPAAYEEAAEGDRLVEAEVGLDVPVNDSRDLGSLATMSHPRTSLRSAAIRRCWC